MLGLSPALISLLMSLGVGSIISSLVYWLYNLAYERYRRNYYNSVVVDNSQPVYKWLLTYLLEKDYLNKDMTTCQVKTVK